MYVDRSATLDTGAMDAHAYPPARQAWAMVGLLMIANVFSFVDRQIISLLVDPIRRDMGVSDVQVSLLIGPAFAVFFCIMALPLGRMVDSRNRIRLAAVGVGLWSLATFLSGFADTFAHLFAARVGVAVGEAALFPAANSLIADSFPPHRRARAIGVFALAIYLGSGLALLFGGAVVGWAESGGALSTTPGIFAGFASWQLVLLAVGAPGLVIAAAIAMLKEPARRGQSAPGGAAAMPLRAVLRHISSHRRLFLCHFLSFGTFVLAGYAVLAWAPTHLVRSMNITRAEAGYGLGLAVMLGGLIGVIGGTTLADRLAARGVRDGKFRIAAGACTIGALIAILLAMTSTATVYIALIGLMTVCSSTGIALGPAALQEIAPNEMRGQALAAYQLVATVVGAGLGPPLVALLAKTSGMPIGEALSIVAAGALSLGAIGFIAGRHLFGREAEDRIQGLVDANR